jgi:hypothetical protein
MSRAYRENQIKQLEDILEPYTPVYKIQAGKLYKHGGRIVPMWVRVFHATEYNWKWVHLLTIAGAFYYATIAKEEFDSNPWSIVAIPIILFVLIAPFVASYRELKKEQ